MGYFQGVTVWFDVDHTVSRRRFRRDRISPRRYTSSNVFKESSPTGSFYVIWPLHADCIDGIIHLNIV